MDDIADCDLQAHIGSECTGKILLLLDIDEKTNDDQNVEGRHEVCSTILSRVGRNFLDPEIHYKGWTVCEGHKKNILSKKYNNSQCCRCFIRKARQNDFTIVRSYLAERLLKKSSTVVPIGGYLCWNCNGILERGNRDISSETVETTITIDDASSGHPSGLPGPDLQILPDVPLPITGIQANVSNPMGFHQNNSPQGGNQMGVRHMSTVNLQTGNSSNFGTMIPNPVTLASQSQMGLQVIQGGLGVQLPIATSQPAISVGLSGQFVPQLVTSSSQLAPIVVNSGQVAGHQSNTVNLQLPQGFNGLQNQQVGVPHMSTVDLQTGNLSNFGTVIPNPVTQASQSQMGLQVIQGGPGVQIPVSASRLAISDSLAGQFVPQMITSSSQPAPIVINSGQVAGHQSTAVNLQLPQGFNGCGNQQDIAARAHPLHPQGVASLIAIGHDGRPSNIQPLLRAAPAHLQVQQQPGMTPIRLQGQLQMSTTCSSTPQSSTIVLPNRPILLQPIRPSLQPTQSPMTRPPIAAAQSQSARSSAEAGPLRWIRISVPSTTTTSSTENGINTISRATEGFPQRIPTLGNPQRGPSPPTRNPIRPQPISNLLQPRPSLSQPNLTLPQTNASFSQSNLTHSQVVVPGGQPRLGSGQQPQPIQTIGQPANENPVIADDSMFVFSDNPFSKKQTPPVSYVSNITSTSVTLPSNHAKNRRPKATGSSATKVTESVSSQHTSVRRNSGHHRMMDDGINIEIRLAPPAGQTNRQQILDVNTGVLRVEQSLQDLPQDDSESDIEIICESGSVPSSSMGATQESNGMPIITEVRSEQPSIVHDGNDLRQPISFSIGATTISTGRISNSGQSQLPIIAEVCSQNSSASKVQHAPKERSRGANKAPSAAKVQRPAIVSNRSLEIQTVEPKGNTGYFTTASLVRRKSTSATQYAVSNALTSSAAGTSTTATVSDVSDAFSGASGSVGSHQFPVIASVCSQNPAMILGKVSNAKEATVITLDDEDEIKTTPKAPPKTRPKAPPKATPKVADISTSPPRSPVSRIKHQKEMLINAVKEKLNSQKKGEKKDVTISEEETKLILRLLRKGAMAVDIFRSTGIDYYKVFYVKQKFEKFLEDGNDPDSFLLRQPSEILRVIRNEALIDMVIENPNISLHGISRLTGVASGPLRQLIYSCLHYKTYVLKCARLLTELAKGARKERCNLLLKDLRNGPAGPLIFFYSEKVFTQVAEKFSYDISRWLCSINYYMPQLTSGQVIHIARVMVLQVISSHGHVMPPIFIRNAENVDDEQYLDILSEVIMPWCRGIAGDQEFTFQRGFSALDAGLTGHSWLKSNLTGKARYWSMDQWPRSSPDLDPSDYFLWSYVEHRVNKVEHPDLESLQEKIEHEMLNLSQAMVKRACSRFKERLEACYDAGGGEFNQCIILYEEPFDNSHIANAYETAEDDEAPTLGRLESTDSEDEEGIEGFKLNAEKRTAYVRMSKLKWHKLPGHLEDGDTPSNADGSKIGLRRAYVRLKKISKQNELSERLNGDATKSSLVDKEDSDEESPLKLPPYFCETCNWSFASYTNLLKHFDNATHKSHTIARTQHEKALVTSPERCPDSKPKSSYHCEVCDINFLNLQNLKNHRSRLHVARPKRRLDYCRLCDFKLFSCKKKHQEHIRLHLPEGPPTPYQCKQCGTLFGFEKSSAFTRHLATHNKEEFDMPCQCTECTADNADTQDLDPEAAVKVILTQRSFGNNLLATDRSTSQASVGPRAEQAIQKRKINLSQVVSSTMEQVEKKFRKEDDVSQSALIDKYLGAYDLPEDYTVDDPDEEDEEEEKVNVELDVDDSSDDDDNDLQLVDDGQVEDGERDAICDVDVKDSLIRCSKCKAVVVDEEDLRKHIAQAHLNEATNEDRDSSMPSAPNILSKMKETFSTAFKNGDSGSDVEEETISKKNRSKESVLDPPGDTRVITESTRATRKRLEMLTLRAQRIMKEREKTREKIEKSISPSGQPQLTNSEDAQNSASNILPWDDFLIPLANGWVCEKRCDGSAPGGYITNYWSPEGHKFTSKDEVQRHLVTNNIDLSMSMFDISDADPAQLTGLESEENGSAIVNAASQTNQEAVKLECVRVFDEDTGLPVVILLR